MSGAAAPDGARARLATQAALVAALVLLPGLAGTLIVLLPLAGADVSRMYNEGWNAFHQVTAGAGQHLYPAPPDWTVANYPPLSFWLVGGVARLFGWDVVAVGRAVSLCAFLVCGLLVGRIAGRASGLAGVGVAAALGFWVTAGAVMADWLATNEPHLLGLAFALAGLAVHAPSAAEPAISWRRALLCTGLFATALAVKQSFIAFPLAIALFEVARLRLPRLVRFAVTGTAWLCLLVASMALLGGPAWREHLLFERNWSVGVFVSNTQVLLSLAGSLLLAALLGCLLLDTRSLAGRFWLLLGGVTLALAVTLSFGGGVSRNIYAELLAASAILAALGCARLAPAAPGLRPVLLLGGLLVLVHGSAAGRGVSALGNPVLHGFRDPRPVERATAEVIGRVAQAPGAALCEDLLVCFRAGKPMLFDPYFVTERILVGQIAESEVVALLRSGHFAVVQLGRSQPYRPEHGAAAPRWRFTPAVLRAIHERYELSFAGEGFGVFTPRKE